MLGRVKLDNILFTRDQGNFNRITVRSRNRTLVTVVRDTCTTTVPPTPLAPFDPSRCLRLKVDVRGIYPPMLGAPGMNRFYVPLGLTTLYT